MPHIFSVTEENLNRVFENEEGCCRLGIENINVPEPQQERFQRKMPVPWPFAAAVWYMELLES